MLLDVQPRSGTVSPHGKFPIVLTFKPKEEIIYNFNIHCEVKRKPNKLSLNIKGEGYGVHAQLQLEQLDERGVLRYAPLRPAPVVNYADFGSVRVLDSVTKLLTVLNHGKYNFDYLWDIEAMTDVLTLSGGRTGGTLHKGESAEYKITFAPTRECSLDGSMLSITVAGKYIYNIVARGGGVQPALRFSFMHYDFGPCFITSPGGATVVEETLLRITNNDPVSDIAIECVFQKTRVLSVDCPPCVLGPGEIVDVLIRFAPRDAKDYVFIVPFVINGTGKVPVNIIGVGINARLELANQSQRRLNFGTVNVGSECVKVVNVVNRSKKALPVQILDESKYGLGALEEIFVSFAPKTEVLIAPRESVSLQIVFSPTRRVTQFANDLLIHYAGVTRKLLQIAGKAQGIEVSLDTDSLPFGTVVENSQKVKKLVLENSGDIAVIFDWIESSFGPHFSIAPLSGKVVPGAEVTFDVTFRPKFVDADIRQDDILLSIPGISPLSLAVSGVCISQPSENVQSLAFSSRARKADTKKIKIHNPSDKDWFISPSLEGEHWLLPNELKVPAKGSAELVVTYYPLSMCSADDGVSGEAVGGNERKEHNGRLFLALPDGSAQLYMLTGVASPPECAGQLVCETPAKQPAMFSAKLVNWLGEAQKLVTTVEILDRPSPASFIVAANAVEIAPKGTKDFSMRFVSFVEGITRAKITFTNPQTGEYCYYELVATSTAPEVLEAITLESPVRQIARYILTAENPLPANVVVNMGSLGKPEEWWQCDSPYVRVNELVPFSGSSEGSFEVEFRPLVPTTQPKEHLLTLYSKELGTFKYKLVLTASAPNLRQVLRFQASLGSVQTENFMFRTYNSSVCTFNCSVKKNDFFSVPKTFVVEAVKGWEG